MGCAIVAAIAACPEAGPLCIAGALAAPVTFVEPQRGHFESGPAPTASNCSKHD